MSAAEKIAERVFKEPLELIVKDRGDTVAWACGACGVVRADNAAAVSCCWRNCEDCDVLIPLDRAYWMVCSDCSGKRSRARSNKIEADHLRDAKLVSACDYALSYDCDWVYWEGHGFNEGFFESCGELEDYCSDEDIDLPDQAWACSPNQLTLDAKEIVADALESGEHYEGADENVSEAHWTLLQTILDAWCKDVAIVSYMPNYHLRVVLDDDIETEHPSEEENHERHA